MVPILSLNISRVVTGDCSFLPITNAERELVSPPMKIKFASYLKKTKKCNSLPPISKLGFSSMTACLRFLLKSLSSDVPNKTTASKGLVDPQGSTYHNTSVPALPDALWEWIPMPKKPIDFSGSCLPRRSCNKQP